MKQEIKLSGGLSLTLDENQKKELLEQLNETNKKELVKQEIIEIFEKYKSNVRFLDENYNVSKYPTSHFEIFNDDGDWLFYIDYDSKNQRFWYSYHKVWMVFKGKHSINIDDFQEVMKSILEEHLNLKGVTPLMYNYMHHYQLEEHLNLKGVTPQVTL